MVTELYIISGFLGAGKTTFIKRMIEEVLEGEQVVVIENDFGEISVDAALLKDTVVKVTEMNAGCICCSLSGDFAKAVEELVVRYKPDRILIEPSGVGKLSDIIRICENERLRPLIKIKRKITVVDASRFEKYLRNYGEFFEDQIRYADTIVFTHQKSEKESLKGILKRVHSINGKAKVIEKDVFSLSMKELMESEQKQVSLIPVRAHHCRGKHCHCHEAEEVFDTVTIRTKEKYRSDELEKRLRNLMQQTQGEILRAKGIVKGEEGFVNFQYIPGEMKISKCEKSGDMICVIGHNLNPKELRTLFFEG